MSTPPHSSLPPELDPRGPRKPQRGAPGGGGTHGTSKRALKIAAIAMSVVVLVGTGVLYGVFRLANANLTRIDAFGFLGKHRPPKDAAAQNFLLVGSDTRQGANGAYQASKGSADYVTGQRSDTMMIVHIPKGPAKATIVSFPRDSWVTIPAWTDPKTGTHTAEHTAKLNSAFTVGGPALLIATLERMSGLRIDHYVQIDFTGFKNMVNALHGVDICVRTSRHDHDSGDNLKAGTTHVNGDQALAFVRDRKGLPRGDLDRITDQQYFLSVVLHKLLSAGTLTNVGRLYSFIEAASKAVTVDKAFGISAMKTLGLRLRHLDPAHVTFVQLPVLDDNARRDGQSVVLLDEAKLPTVFASMRGETPPAKSTASPVPTDLIVAPSGVHVRVLNGTGKPGLAGDVAAQLRNVGFDVVSTGNAPAQSHTTVSYGPSKADSARTLAAAVPGATMQADSSLGGTLTLVVGPDFSTVRAVTVGGHAGSGSQATSHPSSGGATGSQAPVKSTTAADAACAP